MNRLAIRIFNKTLSCKIAVCGVFLLGTFQSSGQMFIDMAQELGVTAMVQVPSFGSGLSTYDFNQDGLDDISLSTNLGNLIFYENQGGYFEQIGPSISAPGQTKQVIWADIMNDGHPDLFVTSYTGPCKLYSNTGEGSFQNISEEAGLPSTGNYHSGASFGDYNRDGFLDLYICVYKFSPVPPEDFTQYNRLYRNNGDGTFTDVTVASGIQFLPSMSFQSVWLDYNNDLWPDLYVINDRHLTGNRLFLNNGNGTFSDVTTDTGMEFYGQDIMSNSVSDYNNDGYLDVFLTNAGNVNPPKPSFLAENYNGFYFNEVGEEMGVQLFEFFWGALWIDANNNGLDDLYITRESTQQDRFYINTGNGFNDAQELLQMQSYYPTYSPAKGDFNNDGFSDMAVQADAPNKPLVLMNQNSANNYIKVTPHGTLSNKQAVGSWIRAYFGENTLSKYTMCGENYLGQNSQHLIFGVGENMAEIDSLRITYTSGHSDTYYNLPTDSAYHFYEGETYTNEVVSLNGHSFCEGDSMVLDAGVHQSYQWSTGQTNRFITIYEAGEYTVTTSNEFGIETTASIDVDVNPLPNILVETIDIACAGDSSGSIHLQNQTGISPDSIWWNTGMEGDSIFGLGAGAYDYLYTDVNGCATPGSVLLSEPDSMIIIANSYPETGADDGGIVLAIFGGTPPFQVLLNGSITGASIQNLSAGLYTVTIIDHNGCVQTVEIAVESVLSQHVHEEQNRVIYPNPVESHFSISNPNSIKKLQLNDLSGKKIRQLIPKSQSNKYDISTLSSGFYTIQVTGLDDEVTELKLIKK